MAICPLLINGVNQIGKVYMKVILFGASGMVGSAVLRESLLATDVEKVLTIGRSALKLTHPKLESIVLNNLYDYQDVMEIIAEYDACLFCLGTSSGDRSEEEYIQLNQTLPLTVAEAFHKANPEMAFVYISGKGTDSTESGKVAWARIKGKTENSLLGIGFKAVYLLRPALIIPKNGEQSKTTVYRLLYQYTGWAMQMVQGLFPSMITDTEKMGRAIFNLLRKNAASAVIENAQINSIAK